MIANDTWETYYADIPSDIILKGKEQFPFSIGYEWISAGITLTAFKNSLLYHLKQAPIQITIPSPNPNHAVLLVAIVGDTYFYYDSYPPYLKSMNVPPVDALKIVLYSGKIYARKVGWLNSPEKGVYLPADTMARFDEIKNRLPEWFPIYELHPQEFILGKKPF